MTKAAIRVADPALWNVMAIGVNQYLDSYLPHDTLFFILVGKFAQTWTRNNSCHIVNGHIVNSHIVNGCWIRQVLVTRVLLTALTI